MSKPASHDLADIARNVAKKVAGCSSEEDLRVAVEMVVRDTLPDLPTPKYEKAVHTSTFRGRADAVHHGMVIEYEKPRTMRGAKARQHAVKQVCDYLTGFALVDSAKPDGEEAAYSQTEEERLAANVGVATDGETFVFVQRRNRQWHEDERRLDEDTVEKLLLWLRAMVRKDLSPEHLIADFGPETELATDAVGVLAKLVASGEHPKANVIYDEWRRMFGIVYGTEQLERPGKSPEAQALKSAYQIKIGVKFPVLLFAVHTYYALLMKMLATELIVAQGSLGDSFVGSLARTKLRKQLAELESGEILHRYNIKDAIEQDFFGWYTDAWTTELQDVVWRMVQALEAYDIATFQVKPERARDLLKDLYHGLIPEAVRHALGEYYTPDWLAERTIDEAGFDGDPGKRFLDPACGSGTFLILAIERVRQWLANRSVEWGTNEKRREAVNLIRHHIVGFDLNPLAVIASRTNYLFALGPLLRYRGSGSDFEIPVYLTGPTGVGRRRWHPGTIHRQGAASGRRPTVLRLDRVGPRGSELPFVRFVPPGPENRFEHPGTLRRREGQPAPTGFSRWAVQEARGAERGTPPIARNSRDRHLGTLFPRHEPLAIKAATTPAPASAIVVSALQGRLGRVLLPPRTP